MSTPSLPAWGAGRSANVPGLGFGTARIRSGHKLFLAWLQLRAQRSGTQDRTLPHNSPQTQPQGLLAWIQSLAEPRQPGRHQLTSFQRAQGSWRAPLVIPQPVHGGSSRGQWGQGASAMVAAGVGRLHLLCRGVSMASGSPGHPHAAVITPWELLLRPFLSQTLLRGKRNGEEERTAHFSPSSQCRQTWMRSLLPQASHRQEPSPCNSPASLKWGPAPSLTRCQET